MKDLPLFGLSLNWSLLTALMETSHWARESATGEIDEPRNPLAWIESGPLRDVMPLAVGVPATPASDREALPGSYRNEIYGGEFPTGSWLQVDGLALPDFMIEIELQAHSP
ncbi:hypothetical protein Q6D67_07460 [Haliea sp. E1-2-M8]|uniref:hypothetical protein n=1 Tax=Haliea sp. E1-2-M8 TaxID=3064706 RepID=UPI00271ACCEE|nr:hypothetical protein [Haliea sp. E1-2-M8]MDO8861535.1 hypothetical protein [Haliea sp. E1-2-M8]